MNNQSEVAQLRARIELELAVLHQLQNGFAVVASHEIITHHYTALGRQMEELATYVGEQQAVDEVCERYNQLI